MDRRMGTSEILREGGGIYVYIVRGTGRRKNKSQK